MFFNTKVEFNPLDVSLPFWAEPLFHRMRYKGIKGGRGSGKSHGVAEILIMKMVKNKDIKIVSVREHAVSTKDSTRQLFIDKIDKLKVNNLFKITNEGIYRVGGKGKIIFRGLKDHNAGAIKSLEGYDIAWVEEAQQLSKASLDILEPTIRKEGSEIWFTWNPYLSTDAVDTFFEAAADYPEEFILIEANYIDNPFLPKELYRSALRMRKISFETYQNVWMGQHLKRTDDQIFAGKWKVGTKTPNERTWSGPYHGLDFGFAKDPMAGVRVWITDDNYLYIEAEAGEVGIELDDASDFLIKKINGFSDHVVRADSSNPQNISYLKRHGLNKIEGVDKWPKSVEEGIEHIKTYNGIIVHPDCKQVQFEMMNYKYKTDKQTGDILPIVLDKHNHYIDALRYALAPLIKDDGVFMDYDKLM